MNTCPKCGINYEGNFCPNGCGSQGATNEASHPPVIKKQGGKAIAYILIAMMAVNIILNGITLAALSFGSGSSTRSAEAQIEETRLMEEYKTKIGKNIEISGVSVETSEYGSDKLAGYATNTTNKDMESVWIYYDFYYENDFVSSELALIDKLPAGAKIKFTLYVPDEDCDTYRLDVVEALYAE